MLKIIAITNKQKTAVAFQPDNLNQGRQDKHLQGPIHAGLLTCGAVRNTKMEDTHPAPTSPGLSRTTLTI